MKGIVFDIKHFAVHDGPGIRTTVFLKGCPLRCWWCHNPESQDIKSETAAKKVVLDGIAFDQTETIGRLMEVEEVMAVLDKEAVFYDESGGGITFSGGEPLMQPEFLEALLRACKQRGYHTAVDTSGFTATDHLRSILPYTDLFLYDLKLMDAEAHRKYTGHGNKQILENLDALFAAGAAVIIRIPVIPGINDDDETTGKMITHLNSGNVREIHLLPYHAFAKNKYRRFDKKNLLAGLEGMDHMALESIRKKFETHGFVTRIGG